jgi:cellulose synthase/poly-beta-1,6-N-acetylglucosamine synthase-like glycosyltransferase
MIRIWELLFWFSVAWLLYVYAGYPFSLWILGVLRPFRSGKGEHVLPRVSVLISARNEEKDIERKVQETLQWDYPVDFLQLLIASDASEDRTDEILAKIADSRLTVMRMGRRVGKNEALNRLASQATGDILFFTDANSHIASDCLRKMVGHFADSRVGCVTGVEQTIHDEGQAVVSGTRAYLGYESSVAQLESRIGSVLVCDGAIFCIRRNLFAQLQPDLANDLELPLRIGGLGYALLFDPSARASEKSTASSREEFSRKQRIAAQGILGFWRLRKALKGIRTWQFLSRKLLRWLVPVPLTVLLIASAALAHNKFFLVFLALQLAAYAAALIAAVLESMGLRAGKPISICYYFILVHIAAILGVVQACLGRRFAVWEVASESRGSERRAKVEKA